MKAIILPCTPAECEKIVNGDISILVRKVVPKESNLSIKIYIYCGKTYSENVLLIDKETKEAYFGDYRNGCCCDIDGYVDCFIADDNVIGEFICNEVEKFYCASVPYRKENNLGYEHFVDNGVYKVDGWHEGIVFERNDKYIDTMLKNKELSEMCLSAQELFDYIGIGKHLYGLHISDLKIYDEPRELSEFKKADCDCPFPYVHLPPCPNCDERDIKRPPKNYIYVEE